MPDFYQYSHFASEKVLWVKKKKVEPIKFLSTCETSSFQVSEKNICYEYSYLLNLDVVPFHGTRHSVLSDLSNHHGSLH